MSTSNSPYHRILLKLSGESFAAPGQRGIAMHEVVDIAAQTYRAAVRALEAAPTQDAGSKVEIKTVASVAVERTDPLAIQTTSVQ